VTYDVYRDGVCIAREVDGDTAVALVNGAGPGVEVRRGLVLIYFSTEFKPATTKRLQFRARVASYPDPCSIYGVVSWQEGLRFGRLLRLLIHWMMICLCAFERRPSSVAKSALPPVCM